VQFFFPLLTAISVHPFVDKARVVYLKRLSTGSVDDLLLQQKRKDRPIFKKYIYIIITITGKQPAKY
jgi:hypothetical protein